jgi:hypothetical protein
MEQFMNDLSRTVMSSWREHFDARQCELLQNPLWYVTVVTCLAGFTIYLRLWWWLTAAVALIWGLWLVWQIFSSKSQNPVDDEAQLQGWLMQALDYRTKIKQALKRAEYHNNLLCEPSLIPQLDAWIDVIQALTQRLALLRHDDLVIQEIATVPTIIEALESQLLQTSDATIRAELEQALTHRRKQMAGLEHLQSTVKQAEIQIESTLSLLSTVYAQILTGQSVVRVATSHRFLTGIDEEVNRLQDRLEALCEVKGVGVQQPSRFRIQHQ